jgi:Protein of unknown function (DUF4231)
MTHDGHAQAGQADRDQAGQADRDPAGRADRDPAGTVDRDPAAEAGPDARRLLQTCSAVLRPMVRFGVTGHRDLTDADGAGAQVTSALCLVLETLAAARQRRRSLRLMGSPEPPLGYQIVSPLAEGADRVVAGMAASPDPRLRTRPRELAAPLPFPVAYYRGSENKPGSDCTDAASQAEFDRWYALACWKRPLRTTAPASEQQRDHGYCEVGKFVVEHCDLLFALWNGRDNALTGGTAATIRLALQRGIPVIWIPVTRRSDPAPAAAGPDGPPGAPAMTGPALLIPPADVGDELAEAARAAVALASKPAAAVLAGRRKAHQPVPELLAERLARLAELVRYAGHGDQARQDLADRLATAIPDAGQLGGTVTGTGRVTAVIGAVSAWVEAPTVLADSLARHYQRRLRVLSIGVYAAAATAVALGAFAAILFPFGGAWRLPVVLEAAVLIALLAVQWLDLRRIYRDRWVSYRAMCEYLRIGRYLALVTPAGTGQLDFTSVVRPSSWSSEPSLTPWFAPVLARLWELRPDTKISGADVDWLRQYLITDWIDGQICYHQNRRDLHHRWDRSLRWAIGVILLATVLGVVLHAVRDYLPGSATGPPSGRDLVSVTLAFLVIVLTSVAAAVNGYAGLQRHSYHEARFRRMARELTAVRAMLRAATSLGELRRDIIEVRRVTLGEATDWFEDMRDQQIESPT